VQVVLGKALAGAALVAGGYALLAASTLAAARFAFGFRDLVEILPNGAEFPLVEASALEPELRRALASAVLPLLGYFGVGLAAPRAPSASPWAGCSRSTWRAGSRADWASRAGS
jgi:hypothetical protein